MRWTYRETVLTLCTLAFFVTMVGRLAISPVVTQVTDHFEVSNALVGAALSGMWLTYALAQFPSGILADRFGERRVILVSIAGTALTGLLIAAAPLFAVFVVGTVALGAAAGLHYSVATTLLSRTYDDIGTAIGLHNSGAPIAGLLTPIVVVWIADTYGWRPAVAITVVVGAPALVLFAWKVRPTPARRPDQAMRERLEVGPMVELLSRPSLAFSAVVAVLVDFSWQGIASFLPTFLIEYRGLSPTLAGVAFGVYFVAQGLLQVGVGAISDRHGRDVATAICTVAGTAGLAVLVLAPGQASVWIGIGLLGLGMSWGAPVIARVMDNLSDAERGAGFGLVRTSYMVVAATGSVVVGALADVFGWAVSFGVLTGLLLVVTVVLAVNWLFDLGY